MARGKELLFYRKEDGQDVWQYGRFRAAGVRWMLRNGWREIDWMQMNEGE